MTLVHLVDVARGLIMVHERGRWAHINVRQVASFAFFIASIPNEMTAC